MKRTKRTHYGKQTIARDPHNPTEVYVETVTDDKAVLEHNAKVRARGDLNIGSRIRAIDEHADLSTAFQFPTVMDYQLCKARHSDLFKRLEEGGDVAIRAGEQLALLEPRYVLTVRRGDRCAARSNSS